MSFSDEGPNQNEEKEIRRVDCAGPDRALFRHLSHVMRIRLINGRPSAVLYIKMSKVET
jgi:hypothetical protein